MESTGNDVAIVAGRSEGCPARGATETKVNDGAKPENEELGKKMGVKQAKPLAIVDRNRLFLSDIAARRYEIRQELSYARGAHRFRLQGWDRSLGHYAAAIGRRLDVDWLERLEYGERETSAIYGRLGSGEYDLGRWTGMVWLCGHYRNVGSWREGPQW